MFIPYKTHGCAVAVIK